MTAYKSRYAMRYVNPPNDDKLNEAAERAFEKLDEHDREIVEAEIIHLQATTGGNSAESGRVYIKGLGDKGARELVARLGMWLARNTSESER